MGLYVALAEPGRGGSPEVVGGHRVDASALAGDGQIAPHAPPGGEKQTILALGVPGGMVEQRDRGAHHRHNAASRLGFGPPKENQTAGLINVLEACRHRLAPARTGRQDEGTQADRSAGSSASSFCAAVAVRNRVRGRYSG